MHYVITVQFSKSGNCILIWYHQLIHSPNSNFALCSNTVLYPGTHSAFSCHVFLVSFEFRHSLSLPVLFLSLTLTFLKSTDHLFCRRLLDLGLSDVSSWLDLGDEFGADTPRSDAVSPWVHPPMGTWCWAGAIIGDVIFDYVAKVVCVRFLIIKLLFFPLGLWRNMWGDTLRLCKYPEFIKLVLTESVNTLFAKWWFFSFYHSTFIHSLLLQRRVFPTHIYLFIHSCVSV